MHPSAAGKVRVIDLFRSLYAVEWHDRHVYNVAVSK